MKNVCFVLSNTQSKRQNYSTYWHKQRREAGTRKWNWTKRILPIIFPSSRLIEPHTSVRSVLLSCQCLTSMWLTSHVFVKSCCLINICRCVASLDLSSDVYLSVMCLSHILLPLCVNPSSVVVSFVWPQVLLDVMAQWYHLAHSNLPGQPTAAMPRPKGYSINSPPSDESEDSEPLIENDESMFLFVTRC